MAKYEVTVPGRGRFEVTGPDGMSDAEVYAHVERAAPSQQSWGEYAGGLARRAAQGFTLSGADEAEAGVRSLFGGGSYDDIVTDIRRQNERFARDNPIASTAAEVVGGVAPFLAGPGAALARLAVGRTMGGTVARSAALGGATGAVSGFGAGEGGVAERLPSAMMGAGVGAGFGAAVPPVLAGAGRVLSGIGSAVGATSRTLQAGRGRPSADFEPPITPVGRPIEGATFMADGAGPPAPEAFSAQQGALRMISDWITSAGGTIDDVERAWRAVQQSTRFHSSGEALNAQTLLEIYPPLQRLMRAAASGYREVGEDATRLLEARQTGILPRGTDAGALAQRGVPTRERFQLGRTVDENLDQFGVQLGTGAGNVSPTGQVARIVDATKRLFRIKDFKFHGHASTAGKTSDEILAAMRAESAPAYTKAFAVGDMVSVRPAIQSVMQRWGTEAAQYGHDYRNMIARAFRRFVDADGEPVARLRAFDKAKQKLDSDIGAHLRAGRDFEARELTRLKNEILEAIDGVAQGDLGQLYAGARGIYAKGARDRDILDDFKGSWKDDPDEVLKRYDALSTDEDKKLARNGIVWGMEAEAAGKRAAQDATLAFDVNRAERMLTLIGQRMRAGEDDAADVMRKFGSYISGEQEMVRGTAKTVIGGSMTDRNLQDALAMGGMEIIQNVQSFANIWRGSSSLFEVGRGVLEMIVNRAFGLSADRAREMSRMLLTANPQEITAIIARLRMTMPANRMTRFNELMQQAQQAFGAPAAAGISGAMGGATAGAAPTAVSSGGPVSF